MTKIGFASLLLLWSAACGSSGRASAPSPGAAAAAPSAPSAAEVRAIALTAASGQPPTREAACFELRVFEEGNHDACQPGTFDGSRAEQVPAPWTSADVVRLNAGGENDSTACALIVAVGGAAYVARDWLAFCDDDDKALASAKWSLSDVVAGGAPELVLELTRDEQEILDGERTPSVTHVYRTWCGVGPSGTPSCTPPIDVAQAAASRPVFP